MTIGGGRYPLYVDVMVCLSILAFGFWIGQTVIFRIQNKHTPERFAYETEDIE